MVAPGGYAPDENALARAEETLQSYHCRVKFFCDPFAKYQRFGGTDDARVAQLHAAASDPDIHIVLSLRGGYGMSRLLPEIDFNMLAKSGKLFVGYSDFTAFQMGLLAQAGATSFAGPMICDDFIRTPLNEFTLSNFWQCLCKPRHVIEFAGEENPILDVEGTLWGGNLSMLTHLLGTPYFPTIDNGILFVEDVSEHPYRIERMLLQLFHAGVIGGQKAIVLGAFSNYRLSEYDNGYDFAAMLNYVRGKFNVPVLTGLPFGHIDEKVTLPVGGHAHLRADRNGACLTVNAYPFLSNSL